MAKLVRVTRGRCRNLTLWWFWTWKSEGLPACFSNGNNKNVVITFTGSVRSSKDGTLFYSSKGREQLSDILFSLLLAEHAHEQLSVCSRKTKLLVHCLIPITHINITNAGAIPYNRWLILTLRVRAYELAIVVTEAIYPGVAWGRNFGKSGLE